MSSPSEMSRFTATMSARCTITSAIRRSCRPRMLRSMVRSIAEKPTSSGVEASRTPCRSSRTEPGFQPNNVRMARLSQFSEAGRNTSPSCTTAGRLRVFFGLSWVGSESGISGHPVPVRVGVGNAELRQDRALESFHRLGIIVVFVVVADQMQKAMHGQMAEMVVERFLFVVGLAAGGLIGDRNVAEHARGIVCRSRAGGLQRRKRQHVGRLVLTAPVLVQG